MSVHSILIEGERWNSFVVINHENFTTYTCFSPGNFLFSLFSLSDFHLSLSLILLRRSNNLVRKRRYLKKTFCWGFQHRPFILNIRPYILVVYYLDEFFLLKIKMHLRLFITISSKEKKRFNSHKVNLHFLAAADLGA